MAAIDFNDPNRPRTYLDTDFRSSRLIKLPSLRTLRKSIYQVQNGEYSDASTRI
jgi:hypothetical protein